MIFRVRRLTSGCLEKPSKAEIYRGKVADLHAALNEGEATRAEATNILRSLIDAIVLTPQDGELKIELRGDLAGVLSVAANKKSPSSTDGLVSQVEMVAGTRNRLCRTISYIR